VSRVGAVLLLCGPMAAVSACTEPTFRDGVECRAGTELRDNDGPPDLFRQWCVQPDGRKHGREVQWYGPGIQKLLECHNENGLRHGRMSEWDKSGHKILEGEYTRGQPSGRWKEWQYGAEPEGTLVGEWECEDGRAKRIKGRPPHSRCR
jgi:hypothetical protein